MKTLLPCILISVISLFSPELTKQQTSITGAWLLKDGDDETVFICKDGYILITEYNPINTAFHYSSGGSYQEIKGQLVASLEFTTSKSELQQAKMKGQLIYSISGDKLSITKEDSIKKVLNRVDDGGGAMAGVWKKPGQQGDEKTLLILSGKRFQRIRYNAKTKELISSYGGHYDYNNGKYTEHIEFYRKDPEMIGKTISFAVEIEKDRMTIKGKNEKGEGVEEEWSRKG